MKVSNFSDAQKAFILKQGDDGVPVAEICWKAGNPWPSGESATITESWPGNLLQLAQEISGSVAWRDAPPEGFGG